MKHDDDILSRIEAPMYIIALAILFLIASMVAHGKEEQYCVFVTCPTHHINECKVSEGSYIDHLVKETIGRTDAFYACGKESEVKPRWQKVKDLMGISDRQLEIDRR